MQNDFNPMPGNTVPEPTSPEPVAPASSPVPEQTSTTPVPAPIADISAPVSSPIIPSPTVPSEPASQPDTMSETSSVPFTEVEPAPVAQPISAAFGGSDMTPTLDTSSKKSKKGLIIGLVIAGILLVLGGGSAAAYNLWYQNPDKVLGDALVNTIRAKSVTYTGVANIESSGAKWKLTVDGKNTVVDGEVNVTLTGKYQDKEITFSGSGLWDKETNLYFKINNIQKTLDSLGMSQVVPPSVLKIIKKIDGKWVKISAEDIKEYSKEYSDKQKCNNAVLKKLENDEAVTNEIIDLYSKNRFIVIDEKLGSKDGSLGYVIDGDKSKAKSFDKGFNDTKLAKELQKCDEDFKVDADSLFTDTDDPKGPRVEVWVSRWSHQFTKLQVTGDQNGTKVDAVLEPKFNAPVSVVAPKDTISFKQLQKDIEAAMQEQYSSMQSQAQSTSQALSSRES